MIHTHTESRGGNLEIYSEEVYTENHHKQNLVSPNWEIWSFELIRRQDTMHTVGFQFYTEYRFH